MQPDPRSATLAEVVAGSLRQAFHDGAYACGERLVELNIAAEMSVSQNTVREALRILEGEGWLVKRPRHGVYVRSFTAIEVDELYALRVALESLVLDWALAHLDAAFCDRLREHIGHAAQQVSMGNSYAAREAIFAFHMTLLAAADRPQTTAILHRLYNHARLLENLREVHLARSVRGWRATVNAYNTLLTHLEDGEAEAARAVLGSILRDEGRSLLPLLDLI